MDTPHLRLGGRWLIHDHAQAAPVYEGSAHVRRQCACTKAARMCKVSAHVRRQCACMKAVCMDSHNSISVAHKLNFQ